MGGKWKVFMASAVIVLSATPTAAVAQTCANQMFRVGAGANLPDCRAYERASPADKNGGTVEGFPGLLTTASSGSSVTFFTQAGTGIPASGGATQDFSTYLSTRNGETWSTQRLMPPQALGLEGEFLGATVDQRFAFVEAKTEEGPIESHGLFMINTADESIETIVPVDANHSGNRGYGIDGASSDGSRVLFETRAQLVPEAAPGVDNLYLWSRSTGKVTLAGVLPSDEGGAAPESGSFGGAYEWYVVNAPSIGGALEGLAVQALNATAPDATQVVFTAAETGQLYLRRDLASTAPNSIRLNSPVTGVTDTYVEAEGLEGQIPAAFQEASPDGSAVFFLSSQKLTADANTGENDEGKDLYRWDASDNSLVDITPDANAETPNGAEVQGLLGASDAGTSGFLIARGVLANGAVPGAENLYRFERTGASTDFTLVAVLESGSANQPDRRNYSPRAYPNAAVGTVSIVRSSRVSPDGQTLIFSSVRSLTGYDNRKPLDGECLEERCAEVFRYSSSGNGAGLLDCLSCNVSESPNGPAKLQSTLINGGIAVPRGSLLVNFPLNLSENGDIAFFESPDPLIAADTNSQTGCPSRFEAGSGSMEPYCQDVYEWEAVGAPGGSCVQAEVNGGCLYLLSTGKSSEPSFFAGASTDGQVAFIATTSQLVPEDKDTARDLYGVRVDGGIAAQFGEPAGVCSGESCLDSPNAPPATSPVGSAVVESPGNVKPEHTKHRARHRKHMHRHKHKKGHPRRNHKGRAQQSAASHARQRRVSKGD